MDSNTHIPAKCGRSVLQVGVNGGVFGTDVDTDCRALQLG